MKQARYYFIDGRTKPHKISYYSENGVRAAKFFASKGEALIFQAQIAQELKQTLPSELQFAVTERLIFAQIKAACDGVGAPLQSALDCVKAHLSSVVAVGRDWEAAQEEYLAEIKRRGARPTTITFYRLRLEQFQKRESPENVAKITTERAESYLASILSPNHAKRVLRAFYNFCVARKWVATNPFAQAKLPKVLKDSEEIAVAEVAKIEKIFSECPPEWSPAVALMAFAGLRPLEVVPMSGGDNVIRIENVDFATKKITVPANVAKTRNARVLTELPKNLWAWLAPLKSADKKRNVAPATYQVWRRIKKPFNLRKDELRHSFGSYGYHFLGAEKTVEVMGHVGGFKVFANHYKGLADKKSATEYFSIAPKAKK